MVKANKPEYYFKHQSIRNTANIFIFQKDTDFKSDVTTPKALSKKHIVEKLSLNIRPAKNIVISKFFIFQGFQTAPLTVEILFLIVLNYSKTSDTNMTKDF